MLNVWMKVPPEVLLLLLYPLLLLSIGQSCIPLLLFWCLIFNGNFYKIIHFSYLVTKSKYAFQSYMFSLIQLNFNFFSLSVCSIWTSTRVLHSLPKQVGICCSVGFPALPNDCVTSYPKWLVLEDNPAFIQQRTF